MTHEELLAKIDALPKRKWNRIKTSTPSASALRAVVELHKPEPLDERGDVCLACCPDLLTPYPCPTIQAIEKELK